MIMEKNLKNLPVRAVFHQNLREDFDGNTVSLL